MAIETYISREKIDQRLEEIAAQINQDYAGQELYVVCVLRGSFIFCADLVRKIKVPVEIDFVAASSYGDAKESSGAVRIDLDVKKDITGRNVLLVEDIVDTGLTITYLNEIFEARHPKSLKLASLLYKPARLKHDVKIDYLAFEIEDNFVIGYGLDYAQKYRELPYIGIYSDD
jgi:hypoxanthine phosphoribosyltransferase